MTNTNNKTATKILETVALHSGSMQGLHMYDRTEGSDLVMVCGAISRMPEQSAPYVDTRRAFLGFPVGERCVSCDCKIRALPTCTNK